MASFSSIRQYQAHILGLNAYDRHKKFLKDYANFYGGDTQKQEKLPIKTDQDTLREGYRFIRSEEDDMDSSWEQRLVKRYYDKLFKEYPLQVGLDILNVVPPFVGLASIIDVESVERRGTKGDVYMSHYKTGKIGLRWRTEKEVKSGKVKKKVNFAYFEAGENKQALVKLVTCERCAKKLLYRKLKEKEKEEAKFREKEEHRKKREREEADDDTSTVYERSKGQCTFK
ncbi:protein FRA10AC1 [Tanacetum coccineum]